MKKLCIICMILAMSLPVFGAINVTTNGENRTVTLQYTAATSRVNETLEQAARFLYEHKRINQIYVDDVLVPFDSLSNAQKLGVIDTAVKQILIQWARTQHINVSTETARETAINEDILIEE